MICKSGDVLKRTADCRCMQEMSSSMENSVCFITGQCTLLFRFLAAVLSGEFD